MARRVPLGDTRSAIQAIEEDGGVILTGFSTASDVTQVNADAETYLKAVRKDHASRGLPPTTARVTRLFGRSTTARETWLQQPELLEILKHFLRTVTNPYNGKGEIASDPILSAAATLDIGPGVKAQELHRDDFIWHQIHHGRDSYAQGSDIGIGLLVPGVKTDALNGATLFVPKSHLWDHSRRPMPEEVVAAEMDVSEAFLFLSSAVHAGGGNKTESRRTVHGFFFCRAYIRPEENQFLWFKKDEIAKWSRAALKQAGYVLDHPFLGHCDEKDPIDLFRATPGADHSDFDGMENVANGTK